ncbi:MAG: diguanylate cyclase [Rhodocyclaceae bacterium]
MLDRASDPNQPHRAEKPILTGFAIAALLSLLIALAALYSLVRLEGDLGRVVETNELIVTLQTVQSLASDAEAASRGYAITGDQIFLVSYVRATSLITGQLESLRGLTSTDARQAEHGQKLTTLIGQRLEVAKLLVDTRTSEGFEAARAIVESGSGRRLQDAIRETVSEMRATARGLYQHRAAQTGRTTLITKLIVGLGLVFALLTAFAARTLVKNDYAGSRRAHDELNEANRQLDARVTERTAELTAALQRLQLTDAAFHGTQDGIVITDADGWILTVNPAFSKISEYAETELVGRHINMMQSALHDGHLYQQIWDSLSRAGSWHGAIPNLRKGGEVFQAWLGISRLTDDTGVATHYIGITTDVGRMNRVETELERLAHHDTLTGLPNRLLLMSRLEHSIERARRDRLLSAVLFLDLDRFKQVNDTLGHAAGDALLRQVAERLRRRLREVDTLARLGGDEFVIVLEGLQNPLEAARIAEALIDELRPAFDLDEYGEASIGTSIGIGIFPDHATALDVLLESADKALYTAKREGRNRWKFADQASTPQPPA